MNVWKVVGKMLLGLLLLLTILTFLIAFKSGDVYVTKAVNEVEGIQKTMLTYQVSKADKKDVLKAYEKGTYEDKEALFNRYAKVFREEDKGTILEKYYKSGDLYKDGLYVYYEGLSKGYAKDFIEVIEEYKLTSKAYDVYIFYGPLEQESGIYYYEYKEGWKKENVRPEAYVVKDNKVIWEGKLEDKLPQKR